MLLNLLDEAYCIGEKKTTIYIFSPNNGGGFYDPFIPSPDDPDSGTWGSGGVGNSGYTEYFTTNQINNAVNNAVQFVIANYGISKAYCNVGVREVYKSLTGLNDLNNKNANNMVQYWIGNSSKWIPIQLNEAQLYANMGYLVVAGWINPSSGSGHVVVIVPGEGVFRERWGEIVPCVMDTGENMRSISQPLSQSFGISKKDAICFFKYKK